MKHLFVSDLDGTLLNRQSRVSHRSARIITELSRSGALITVATARTPATVEPLLADIVTTPPAIVMTGAALWDRSSQSFIHPHFITPENTATITAACQSHGINPFAYTLHPSGIIHTYYHGHPTPKEQKFIDERSHLRLKKINIMPRHSDDEPPVYPDTVLIFALGPINRISLLADELNRTGICSVSSYPDIFDQHIAYIEIFAPGVDKASAVRRLKETVGADRLTVFGDNLNDLPMMAVADTSVAVANALPQVKDAADIVIGSNEDDAVALYIEKNL